MIGNRFKHKLFFRCFAVFIGVFLTLLLIEVSLRIGEAFLPSKEEIPKVHSQNKTILFAGDSWCNGADAEAGQSFFDLLKADQDLQGLSLVNVGYGSNNCFQIVNSILDYDDIADVVVVNMGRNSWHLLGLEEFIELSKSYLSDAEIEQIDHEFHLFDRLAWLKKFKIYKLYRYLAGVLGKDREIDIKAMNDVLGGQSFFKMFFDFRERYPHHQQALEALPEFLRKLEDFSLDQKFYLAAQLTAFDTKRMEEILRSAGMFYPHRLKVFPYDVYRRIDIIRRGLDDKRDPALEWAFQVLKAWSGEHDVAVLVQTYPDIKKENLGKDSFDRLNQQIKSYAGSNGFQLIDHNSDGIDWRKYRTCWHVDSTGHSLMKEKIKEQLLALGLSQSR